MYMSRTLGWLLATLLVGAVAMAQGPNGPRITTGAAFVVHPDGYLLTSASTVADAMTVEVTLNGKTYTATVLGSSATLDMAVLKIAATGLPALPLGNSNAPELLGQSVTIRGTRAAIAGIELAGKYQMLTMAPTVDRAALGAPATSAKGEVIGLVTLKGDAPAVTPINYAKSLLRDEGIEVPAAASRGDLATSIATVRSTLATKTNPKDGAEMIWIPAGPFTMGASDKDVTQLLKLDPQWPRKESVDEMPQRQVTVDGFWIYKYEVTVGQYRKFCRETMRRMPPAPEWGWIEDHPMVNVSWEDTSDYCRWAGVRLPSEAEWEKAARGTDGRLFPWGNDWDLEKCNNANDQHPAGEGRFGRQTTPVGSYPQGASPYGVQDMAGNVWEWCADAYQDNYYDSAPDRNPLCIREAENEWGETQHVLRGGSWNFEMPAAFQCTNRNATGPDPRSPFTGFRCAGR